MGNDNKSNIILHLPTSAKIQTIHETLNNLYEKCNIDCNSSFTPFQDSKRTKAMNPLYSHLHGLTTSDPYGLFETSFTPLRWGLHGIEAGYQSLMHDQI